MDKLTRFVALSAIVIIVTLAMTSFPATESEASSTDVATVNGITYPTLTEAIGTATDGDTVVLINDTAVDTTIYVTNSITLDLNGHTITNNISEDRLFYVTASSFIVNGMDEGSSMVIPESNAGSYGFIKVADTSVITVNGGTYTGDTDDGAFIKIFSNDELDASGSTIILNDVTMTSNGRFISTDTLSTDASTPTLIVNGGAYTTEGKAFGTDTLYLSPITFTEVTVTAGTGPCIEVCGSAATFTDCIFTVTGSNPNVFGTTAVAVSWMGTVMIESGTYTSTGYGAYVYSSGGMITINGGTIEGDTAAIRADVDSGSYPTATASVIVTGGYTVGEWQTNGNENVTLTAMGGRHTDDVSEYLADGYILVGNYVTEEGYDDDDAISDSNHNASVGSDGDNVTVIVEEDVTDVTVTATVNASGTGTETDIADFQVTMTYNGSVEAGGLTFTATRVDASTESKVSVDNLVGLFDIDVEGASDDFMIAVTIQVDIPSGYHMTEVWVVYYPDDETEPVVQSASTDGSSITFTADHCSTWGFYAEIVQDPVIWEDDDDDYVPIPPVVYDDSGDDDAVTIVACAAAAVVAAIMAAFLILGHRKD